MGSFKGMRKMSEIVGWAGLKAPAHLNELRVHRGEGQSKPRVEFLAK